MARGRKKCLVGLDGGASTVRAWRLAREEDGSLAVAAPAVRRAIPRIDGFQPASLEDQREDRDRARLRLAPGEDRQAAAVLAHALDVLCAAAGPAPPPLVLGACMPGLKDDAGGSVLVLRHGARLPDFLDALVKGLRTRGLQVAAAPRRLVSDGRAAGWGERYGTAGRLRDVGHALYVAGGTGIAESLLLQGAFPPTSDLRRWFEPAWQLPSPAGRPFEDLISMAAINEAWARAADGDERLVEAAAREGHGGAQETLRQAARHLAAFLFARLAALHRAALPTVGTGLERIVLGQRTADLFADESLMSCFAIPLRNHLAKLLRDTDDAVMCGLYLEGDELKAELIVASMLHAAPALGTVAETLGLTDPIP